VSVACDQLHAFADGELAAPERPAFHRHLAACTACQRALESALMLDALASTFSGGWGPGDEHAGSSGPAALPPSGR
jgi:anti-sigma factor RsiW